MKNYGWTFGVVCQRITSAYVARLIFMNYVYCQIRGVIFTALRRSGLATQRLARPLGRHGARKPLHGFTLIELLVVISVISLLLAILAPSLRRAREKAREINCLSNLRQCGCILGIYAGDNNGCFPTHIDYAFCYVGGGTYYDNQEECFVRSMRPYVANPDMLYCKVTMVTDSPFQVSSPDYIHSSGTVGGWNAFLENKVKWAEVGYSIYTNFTPRSPANQVEWLKGNKQVKKLSDVEGGQALVGDRCRLRFSSLEEAEAYTWSGFDFNPLYQSGSVSHSSEVGGINVLFGGFNAEKRNWSDLEVQAVFMDGNPQASYVFW